ncbi:MAG TPA: hypothetical protein VHA52_03195, partial [Candidatus Babeliaceae bacterium]|nr:hypothetical protein [Candidatus Babeliaceae bacterium]
LMHVPGDKHALPVDYNLLKECLVTADNPVGVIKEFSEKNAGDTTNFSDTGQLDFLEQLAPLLGEAIIADRLCFCIHVKNPFAWIVSISKWEGWRASDIANSKRFIPYVRDAVCRYNDKYRSWLNLKEAFPERTTIIRYEALLESPVDIIKQIVSLTGAGLNDKPEKYFDGIVLPCHWDNQPTAMHHAGFDKSFYDEKRYLNLLSASAIRTISEHIDGELMKSYGYNIEEWIVEKIAL